MEKFHKYCLSVLLVIICSNISAQISSGNAESEDCKQLYELYHQILNHHETGLERFCTEGNAGQNLRIGQKQNAVDLLKNISQGKGYRNFNKNKSESGVFQEEKYTLLLKNFEKQDKEIYFSQILYFKTQVSKVRNKDYLSVLG
jgi:hypothetical protein